MTALSALWPRTRVRVRVSSPSHIRTSHVVCSGSGRAGRRVCGEGHAASSVVTTSHAAESLVAMGIEGGAQADRPTHRLLFRRRLSTGARPRIYAPLPPLRSLRSRRVATRPRANLWPDATTLRSLSSSLSSSLSTPFACTHVTALADAPLATLADSVRATTAANAPDGPRWRRGWACSGGPAHCDVALGACAASHAAPPQAPQPVVSPPEPLAGRRPPAALPGWDCPLFVSRPTRCTHGPPLGTGSTAR